MENLTKAQLRLKKWSKEGSMEGIPDMIRRLSGTGA